jgi:hypothetical protein
MFTAEQTVGPNCDRQRESSWYGQRPWSHIKDDITELEYDNAQKVLI